MAVLFPPLNEAAKAELMKLGYSRPSQLWITKDQLSIVEDMCKENLEAVNTVFMTYMNSKQRKSAWKTYVRSLESKGKSVSPYGREMMRLGFVRIPKCWLTENQREAIQNMAKRHVDIVNEVRDNFRNY